MAKQFTVKARFVAEDRASSNIRKISSAQAGLNAEVGKADSALGKGERATKDYTKQLDKAGAEQKQFNKTLQGTQGELGKTTSRFSKFVSSVKSGGLVVVASLAAIAIASKKALGSIEEGARRIGQRRTLEKSLAAQGIALDGFIAKLQQVSRAQISVGALIASSSKALLLGIPAEKIAALLDVARVSAIATGQAIGKAFDDIATGVGRASPLILDNLGIILKLEPTYAAYAAAVGKTTEELTQQEQKLAILEKVLTVGEERIRTYGEAQATAAGLIDEAKASLKDWADGIAEATATTVPEYIATLRGIKQVLEENAEKFEQSQQQMKEQGVVTGFVAEGFKKLFGALKEVGDRQNEINAINEEGERLTLGLAAAQFEEGRGLLNLLGVSQQYTAHLSGREKAVASLTAAQIRLKEIEAEETAELSELTAGLERLGVILESEVNAGLAENVKFLNLAQGAARRLGLTELDLKNIQDAVATSNGALAESLGIQTDAARESAAATDNSARALERHASSTRQDQAAVDALTGANDRLAASFARVDQFTSAAGETRGRVQVRGGSRLIRDDGRGGAFTPQQVAGLNSTGTVTP